MTLPAVQAAMDRLRLAHRDLLRAVDSLADEAWDQPSPAPRWTHRDLLAHLASNELRVHARLRSVFGETDEAEQKAVNDLDGWNEREVDARHDRSVRELVDELAVHRRQTIRLLSRIRREHLSIPITMADGSTCNVLQYIDMVAEHQSEHAGQLVPTSQARRSSPP